MKKLWCILLIFIIFTVNVEAKSGCCSHHGGVAGCNSNGRQICNDGTLSPSCTCTPTYIYGCTDPNAKNYNRNANKDNGSCIYYVYGCTNVDAINYNSSAEKDDGSCILNVNGCLDQNAINYNSKANTDDGTCRYQKEETITVTEDNKEFEVTYKIIYDKNNSEISREKIKETVVKVFEENDSSIKTESSNKDENNFSKFETKDEEETEDGSIIIILILLAIINYVLIKKDNYNNTIMYKIINLSNILIKILLILLYILIIIPIFIDLVIVIINIIKIKKK